MKFTLSKVELEKLNALVKTAQSVSDVSIKTSHYMFKVDDKLQVAIYGNGNIVNFSVDVTNVIKEPSDTGYFNCDVNQFIQSFEKVFMSSGTDEAVADVQLNKIIVSNGKSRISLALLDLIEESEFDEAFSAYDTKKNEKFADATLTATVTKDVVEFMETVGKFIPMIGTERVSGISVKGNKILYSDQAFSIIDRTVPDQLTDSEIAYIPQSMFNLLSAISKFTPFVKILYSSDNQFSLIEVDEMKFKAILSMPDIICEYPDDSMLEQILPDENNKMEFDVDIPTLLNKMSMFDGVFPSSQWRWKTIEFYNVDEKGADGNALETTMNMRYNNMCAEVDTDLPVMNLVKTGNVGEFSFRLASILIYDYLNKLADGSTTVHIKVSPYAADEEHGVGVVFDMDNMHLITSKMVSEESI